METFNRTVAEITRGISEKETEELKRLLRIMEKNCRSATGGPACAD